MFYKIHFAYLQFLFVSRIIFLPLLIFSFYKWHHFIIEETKELIHLIKAQRILSLFEVSHKAQSYPRLQRKFFLRQIILLSQHLDRNRKIVHKHSTFKIQDFTIKATPRNKSNKFDSSLGLHFIYTFSGAKLIQISHIIPQGV